MNSRKADQMTSGSIKAGNTNANPPNAQMARERVKYMEGSENQPLTLALKVCIVSISKIDEQIFFPQAHHKSYLMVWPKHDKNNIGQDFGTSGVYKQTSDSLEWCT